MKLNKLWASALALLALASCSKDLEPSVIPSEPETPTTRLVQVDIKAGQDDSGLRVGYGVSTEENGALTGLAMVEKDVNLRIAVKQGRNGTPVIGTYKFTKVPGQNLATFSDKLNVPVQNGDEPFYIAAVLFSEGAGEENEKYAELREEEYPTKVIFAPQKNSTPLRPDVDNKIFPNIPYRSQWQEISLNSEGTVINPISLKLKPLGTLLRFRIHNTTEAAQEVARLFFGFPNFTNKGDIDFAYTDVDGFPAWNAYTNLDITYKLPEKITLSPSQKSNWYYLWVNSYTYTQDVQPQKMYVLYQPRDYVNYTQIPIFTTKKLLPKGSVSVTFKIRSGVDVGAEDFPDSGDWENADAIYDWSGTVLSRLSPRVVSKSGNSFVQDDNVRNNQVAYYTYAEAIQRFKQPVPMEIGGGQTKKYSLLTAGEMKSIFPESALPVTTHFVSFFGNRVLTNLVERGITINGETNDFKGDYKFVYNKDSKLKVTYAIRFKDESNKHRTAFKYILEQDGDDEATSSRFVRVWARLLGNSPEFTSLTVDQVAQDSFWTPGSYDERIFPYYGSDAYRALQPEAQDYNIQGGYWSSSLYTSHIAFKWTLTSLAAYTSAIVTGSSSPDYDFPVFLFERK